MAFAEVETSSWITPELAEQLTRSLYCGAWPQEGRVSVYVAWSDESGSGDGKGQFLVAGYGADEKEWPEFSRLWAEQIIQAAPKIPYLHMVDIRSREWREKIGITRDEADEKVRTAVKLIQSSTYMEPYFGSMTEAHYSAAKKLWLDQDLPMKQKHGFADYPCFFAYALSLIHDIAVRKPEVRKIIFNISKQKYVGHYISHDVRDEMIKYFEGSNPELAGLMGDVIPLSMEEYMPLQAADVLCWHLQRTYSKNIKEEDRENVEVFRKRGVCGIEMTEDVIRQIAERTVASAKRTQGNE